MKKVICLSLLAALALSAKARTVSADTICCNDGTTVSVGIKMDEVGEAVLVALTVNYDPTIVSFMGAVAGELADEESFTYATDDGGRVILLAPKLMAKTGGELCRLRFHARTGTAGKFSDVTIAEVHACAKDGVRDLTVSDPIALVRGMIRVMGEAAQVTRLEEAMTIWPESKVGELTLGTGDKLKTADSKRAIQAETVTGPGMIMVEAPLNGWQTGSYAILTTRTEGLAFTLEGVEDPNWRTETENGYTTYYADVTVEGEVAVEFADEGELASEVVAQIRQELKQAVEANPEVETITVKGDAETIPVTVDLGIAPEIDIVGTEMTATYKPPTLEIVSFDAEVGLVRIKVTPGEGNSIRTVLATGCIHVYGTSNLGEKMKYISGTQFDLEPYLKEETKGEADLTVTLGTHTFFKVKASTTIQEIED